ncbi:MAG: hypothetical protein KBT10_07315 [Bacteroidales bacterium]|nr:hypothetical protein [Candidatus Sodaliphilus aphodohippi]
MKKILIIALALLGMASAQAQTDDYTPLVREGSEWYYVYFPDYSSRSTMVLTRIGADTVAYGNTYHKVYYLSSPSELETSSKMTLLVREVNKKVYAIPTSN